jgi:hypothetical protein
VATLILVFAGIAWQPTLGWLWLVPAVYLVLRVGTRLLASRWAVSTFVHGVELRRVGGGLIGQGALAAAIALSYAQGHPHHSALVLSAVLLPMLITDLFAVRTLRRVLANAGAIRPRAKIPDEAPADEPDEAHDEAADATGEVLGDEERPEGDEEPPRSTQT